MVANLGKAADFQYIVPPIELTVLLLQVHRGWWRCLCWPHGWQHQGWHKRTRSQILYIAILQYSKRTRNLYLLYCNIAISKIPTKVVNPATSQIVNSLFNDETSKDSQPVILHLISSLTTTNIDKILLIKVTSFFQFGDEDDNGDDPFENPSDNLAVGDLHQDKVRPRACPHNRCNPTFKQFGINTTFLSENWTNQSVNLELRTTHSVLALQTF